MDERASIGQALRQQREERGLSVEQAAFQSKVPLRLLQSLEADDYRLLPDASYLIGLLHDYARLLGLDPSALEEEFLRAIRRPSGTTLAVVPAPGPPPIPWTQVLWTAAAILVVTPLVFIVLSLASKRAAERPVHPQGEQAPVEELVPADGEGAALVDRFLTWRPEVRGSEANPLPGDVPALPIASPSVEGPAPSIPAQVRQPEAPAQVALSPPGPQAPPAERIPQRFLLTARAVEPTWMAVRADGGQARQVLLQKGQIASFAADRGFVITVGNAGGVNLRLNGEPMPSLGTSGQVVRNLAIPLVRSHSEAAGGVQTPPER